MFSTIRQLRALFKLAATNPTHSLFMSLAPSPIDSPPDETSTEESELWRDYAAAGFDAGGNLLCRSESGCWDSIYD